MLYSFVDKTTGQLLSPKNCFFSYGEARARLRSVVGKHFERFAMIRPVFVDWRIVNRMTGADIYGDFSDRKRRYYIASGTDFMATSYPLQNALRRKSLTIRGRKHGNYKKL